MSPLVLLGLLGTAVSTISMLPHLLHALRHRKPAGSAFAWTFSAFSSGIWFVYGFAIGDVLVAAPGFVTIPIGLGLATWCVLHARHAPALPLLTEDGRPIALAPEPARVVQPVFFPADWDTRYANSQSGDTLELPRIA